MTMTREQEIFNKAYLGLAGQGFEQAVDPLGICQYVDANGRKCAVGHCLTDPTYGTNLNVAALIYEDPQAATDLEGVSLNFLVQLQQCHDKGDTPGAMQKPLLNFASLRNLTVPEVP